MRAFVLVAAFVLTVAGAFAQQQSPPVPLTDWRAAIDIDLSRVSMPRDAHAVVYNILQAYERQARDAKTATSTEPVSK